MHQNICAWVGKCLIHTQPEADEPHEHPWNMQCYAAVWTETYEGFTRAVRDHCQAQGHYLVWAEQVYPILHWLNRHGHHNTMIELAKTVDRNHDIALSLLMPRNEAGQSPSTPTYLKVTEHTIPPLPNQSDKPRWEQDWITPELQDLLFEQPDSQTPLRTYLIVDAGLRTRVSGIFDLNLQDVPVRSLVRPDMAEHLRDVAPYLVDMTLPEGAWNNRRQVPNFHIDFFTHHWHQGTGILIRTTADMDTVWTHFHQFVRVQVENTQEWLFFRYWDPRISYPYLSDLQNDKMRSTQWFTLPGHRVSILVPELTNQVFVISPTDDIKHEDIQKHFIFGESEDKFFRNNATQKFDKTLLNYLSDRNAKFSELSSEKKSKIVSRIIENAKKYKITIEQAIADYAEASLLIGKPLDQESEVKPILLSKNHQLDRTRWVLKYCKAKINLR